MGELRKAKNEKTRARRLIVVLHGYRSKKSGLFGSLLDAIHDDVPDADILAPSLATAKLMSLQTADNIAAEVAEKVDESWRAHGPYAELIVVGHSSGGAIARKVVLDAWGAGRRVPPEAEGRCDPREAACDWAPRISRLILLAGVSSGLVVSGRERLQEWLLLNSFGLMGHLWPGTAKPTFFQFRRGAPFIANTRLQMVDHLRKRRGGMKVIQMLGTSDSTIAPNESLDFNSANARDRLFVIEVPSSNHSTIIDVGPCGGREAAAAADPRACADNPESCAGCRRRRARRALLRSALYGKLKGSGRIGVGPAEPLHSAARKWSELGDYMPHAANPRVKHVVFVVHGIRDDGHWTKKIASRIERAPPLGERDAWKSITSSYGYFAMLPFVLPWIRRQKVEWLMHEYCEAAARYPDATFYFVGHSNGSYLGAAAMRDYRGCRFKRVVFAGSVVHPSYDWGARAEDSGVEQVLNYVATGDWVVALAPNAMRHLRRFFDLGGAGHVGFGPGAPSFVRNIEYVKGGHGAAIMEDRWDEIADFIVDGTVPKPSAPDFQPSQGPAIRNLARVSPFLAAIVVTAALGILADMTLAAVDRRWPAWLAGFVSQAGGVPLLGLLGRSVSSASNWWFDFSPVVNVIGLIVYGWFLRFVTTRY